MLQTKQTTVTSRAFNEREKDTLAPITKSDSTPTFDESLAIEIKPQSKEIPLFSEELTLKFTDNLTTQYTPHEDTHQIVQNEPKLVDLNTKTTQHRITLLSRKYARKNLTQEESVRLDMLTERLRNLVPEITEDEVARMEELTKIIDESSQSVKEIADEFDITL
ncbi:MAG: hypothetical protein ABW134_19470 [Candidatus Thiodiazotropha endolucinida]